MMAQKTTKYNPSGANALPNDKPVVYKIKTESGLYQLADHYSHPRRRLTALAERLSALKRERG